MRGTIKHVAESNGHGLTELIKAFVLGSLVEKKKT
jgi:hypothetical protein